MTNTHKRSNTHTHIHRTRGCISMKIIGILNSYLKYFVDNGNRIRNDLRGKKIRNDFFNPTTYTMADASSLANNIRLSLGPVQVKSVSVNIICVVVLKAYQDCQMMSAWCI